MLADPIVQEVRNAGKELAEEANGDLRKFFANLRLAQEKYKDRLVSEIAIDPNVDLPRSNWNTVGEKDVEQGQFRDSTE